jgi:hypothetical protein
MPHPYKYTQTGGVTRVSDGTLLGQDPANADWLQYQDDGGAAVTDPPDPPPILFGTVTAFSGMVRTTDATPTEIYRVTLAPQTGYAGEVTVIGVDGANGAVKVLRASFAFKRLNAGAMNVGAPVVVAQHADAAATGWGIAPSVSGNDIVLSVTGASGRTIDWAADGMVESFAPGGA